MECFTYLRNVTDLLSDGKTPYERRFGKPFGGPVIPFGSLVEYHPITAKDQSRFHQFGKKVLPGLFLGYALYAGGIWKGDVLIADLEELETMDASEIYSKRLNAKEVIFPKQGEFIFPIADGRIKTPGEDQELRTSTLVRHRPIQGESNIDFFGESEGSLPQTHDSFPVAGEAINDFWSMSGSFKNRHHVEPRVKLYSPREESFPIPLKYIDVTRTTHTNLDVKQEKRIDDYWNIASSSWRCWTALPPMGSRVAGHVCSQVVHWFAAGSCLEILSNCRVSELRVLDLLRDFRNLDDLLHLLFLRVGGLFGDSFSVRSIWALSTSIGMLCATSALCSAFRSELRSWGVTLTTSAICSWACGKGPSTICSTVRRCTRSCGANNFACLHDFCSWMITCSSSVGISTRFWLVSVRCCLVNVTVVQLCVLHHGGQLSVRGIPVAGQLANWLLQSGALLLLVLHVLFHGELGNLVLFQLVRLVLGRLLQHLVVRAVIARHVLRYHAWRKTSCFGSSCGAFGQPTALVYRGCPCRDRCPGKMASGTERQPFVWLVVTVWSSRLVSKWWTCEWTSVDNVSVLHTSSAREMCLFSSRSVHRSTDVRTFNRQSVCIVHCTFAFRYVFVIVSLIPSRFMAFLAIVQEFRSLTHHVLELHRLDDLCVPHSVFLVHVIHVLVLPLDVLQLGLALVPTRPWAFPLCVTHHESVILRVISCGAWRFVVPLRHSLCHSHRSSRLSSVWPWTSPCFLRPRLGIILSRGFRYCFRLQASARSRWPIHWPSTWCSQPLWKCTPRPPPPLIRSRKNFSTSVAVGIVSIDVVSHSRW